MLSQFSFSNYKSFKEEAFLDFVAESIKEHEKSVIIDKADGEKFLPVIVVYGPNGGGKSTVLEALQYLRTIVLRPYIISQMENDESPDSQVSQSLTMEFRDKYHKFDPLCATLPVCFDVMFRINGRQYKYQISQNHNEIVEENLYRLVLGKKDAEIIFERTAEECVLGSEIEDIPVEKLKNTMPLLTHVAVNYNIESVDEVMAWFLRVNIVDYDNPKKERRIVLPKAETARARLFEVMQKMDIHISDFRMEKDADGHIKNIYAKHVLDNGMTVEIPFEEESSGTRKLFSCMARILDCLRDGTLLIADELDAKLHPKLLDRKSVV